MEVTMKSDHIVVLLALTVQAVTSFDCYVGQDSSYEAASCFSCQVIQLRSYSTTIWVNFYLQ